MTGGLLQLIATGLDNIFLTSTPSITMFKLTYRRHTNFSVTQRTKQILNINEFGQNGQYEFEKEGDVIHNIYFNINISDFSLKYELPTYENLIKLFNKYDLNLDIDSTNKITINYYNDIIIPQILSKISYYVNIYNNYNKIITEQNKFLNEYDCTNKNINEILHDNYTYFLSKDMNDNNNENINLNILFLILKSYLKDNNVNKKIYKIKEIYEKILNIFLEKLTYNIIGYDSKIKLEDSFYDSIKLLYTIKQNLSKNIICYDLKTFINNIIENETLSCLKLYDYTKLENYITLEKYINNNNTIHINIQYIDNLLYIVKKNMYYNNDIIYNIIINTLLKYTHNTQHFIFGIYKTFTNNINDTTNFSSTINAINDNLLSIFNKYSNISDIYIVEKILNSIYTFNANILSTFNIKIFNDYFNDITLWDINEFNSTIKSIFSKLYFDKSSNMIIDLIYYYDIINNKFIKKEFDPNVKNIYDLYLNNNYNLYLFNCLPLLIINNLANEIYEEFSKDILITNNIDSSIYEFRNLNEINNINNYNQIKLNNNQKIKNNLYKEILFNIILQINDTKTDFLLSDINFLDIFNKQYTNNDRKSLLFICRPENLFTFIIENKKIKLPAIIYILETFRINILKNIDLEYYDYVYNKLDDIINRYNKFKNTDNLTNNIYSYNSYKLNGMCFANIENNFIQKSNNISYIHAQSSIISYCYNIFIQNYNKLFNDTLISLDFYNSIGSHYSNTYNFIKNFLINENEHYFDNMSFNILKTYYSYNLNNKTIYFYDENKNTNYPLISNGFNYFAINDIIIFNNEEININTLNYKLLSNNTKVPNLFNINYDKNIIFNLENLTYIDIKYLYTKLKLFYNIKTNNIDTTQQFANSPYISNLFGLFDNINYNEISLDNLINEFNSNNLSINEKIILENSLNDIKKNNMLFDEIKNIKNIINNYSEKINPFDSNNLYSQETYNYVKLLNYDKNNFNEFINLIIDHISYDILNDNYILSINTLSDLINYILNTIIQLSSYNFLYKNIDLNNDKYIFNLNQDITSNKYIYLQKILNLTILTDDSKIINTETKFIKFNENIPYINYLYVNKKVFINETDILYHGSELDLLIRNMIEQNPVKTCWVPELGYYILENISLHFDQLLIDEYDSNLLSLLKKINIPYDQYKGLDKIIGNTPNLISYDSSKKGNLRLYIPLSFYFCKNAAISLSMINLLYTKGTIQFKLRKLEDLLIYDKNAIFIKKPEINCNMLVKYIFLEEDERKIIGGSKLEFLIEKYKIINTFYYTKYDILDNLKLISRLRMADPTKYILWRLRVKYQDNNMNNYLWNKNGCELLDNFKYKNSTVQNVLGYVYNNKIKTVSYIKILFNGKIREQGQPQLFNLINSYGRFLGSLNNDEYLYCFSLYPLIYQPSGTANLSHIEDIMVEYTLEPEFIQLIKDNNLVIETEYWTCSYNVLRMISGLCAPLFFN